MKWALISLLVMGIVATGAAGAETVQDTEKIIDVAALTHAMREATQPVADRMEQSALAQRFAEVQAILKAEPVDKPKLLASLQALQTEMESFTSNWEAVMKPLWDGQDALADTITGVRSMMAAGEPDGRSKKTQAMLASYDSRLSDLARAIEAEADPGRKARLTSTFRNVLSLRKLVTRVSDANIGPASAALQLKIVRALTSLQSQLTTATFEVEKVRVILVSEAEFVGNYIDVLGGMIEAESLAKAMADMRADGQGIGAVLGSLDGLTGQTDAFSGAMNGFAEQLADSIEAETAKIDILDATDDELADVNLDDEIRRYAAAGQ